MTKEKSFCHVKEVAFKTSFEEENVVFLCDAPEELLKEMNENLDDVKFDSKLVDGNENMLMLNLATSNFFAHCLWIIDEKELLFRNFNDVEGNKHYESVRKNGGLLGLPVRYKSNIYHDDNLFDLTPLLRKFQKDKEERYHYR